MAVFDAILSLITLPAIVLGFIACVGLLLQKKAAGCVQRNFKNHYWVN
jgi:ascorbate-specific PTS system EIIC-type component UlaA